MTEDPPRFDSLIPPEVAVKAEGIGVKKVWMDRVALVFLAVLAGAVIALGLTRMLGGLAFSVGLVYWIAYRRTTPLVDPFGDGFD